MLSGSYQSPNNESSSRSVLSSTKGISVTGWTHASEHAYTGRLTVYVCTVHMYMYLHACRGGVEGARGITLDCATMEWMRVDEQVSVCAHTDQYVCVHACTGTFIL